MAEKETSEIRIDQYALAGLDLDAVNERLEGMSAEGRVAWTLEHLPGRHLLSSSFGIQAALMLHLVTRFAPGIPVVFIDTGHLFAETYRFVDELVKRLDLNLEVVRSDHSAAWLEARHGRLWEQGLEGIERYNHIYKLEPMKRALRELDAGTWFAGLRRVQSSTRRKIPVVQLKDGRYKVHPVIDWSERDLYLYLTRHRLPYHPLWDQGYVSVGDVHTSRRLEPGMPVEKTRFLGFKRECGLHE
ncbi:MAG: phosphoadenylyl-sulfate reductase [Chromatiaceae bacterium]|jgi:phosphoadenosine phosphosulfate reductase|nr:phosphoadenylyl-sulfate reductase [Chromatiaceae bacterium]